VYAPGAHSVSIGDRCDAVLVHPDTGDELELRAEVLAVDPAGAQLRFAATPYVKSQLRQFVGPRREGIARNVHERVRELNGIERRKLALTGELSERMALERAFGKEVWEPLLRNPKLSVGEVTRLARKGTMPRPLLEQIVQNTAWLRVPQVRRALLANTRMDQAMIRRVLRVTPAPELRLVPRQTAYPMAVRNIAKSMIAR
jgi:hypothetical protein